MRVCGRYVDLSFSKRCKYQGTRKNLITQLGDFSLLPFCPVPYYSLIARVLTLHITFFPLLFIQFQNPSLT